MAKRRKSNPDVVLVRTPLERALCSALVPAHFWHPDPKKISYRATPFRGKQLSAIAQKQWVKRFNGYLPRRSPLIAIGSDPTDTGALHTAYYIVSEYIKLRDRGVAVLDAAQQVSHLETYPGCAIIYNILDKATWERVQQVRDIANQFVHTFKIVVIGGTTNPERWVTSRAALYPDVVLRVKDLTPEELVGNG